jgi:ceramide glucosyltransferase
MIEVLGVLVMLLAVCGVVHASLAAYLAGRFARESSTVATAFPAVTMLKPLHGGEPKLEVNLAAFFEQDYPTPFQIVFGVSDRNDPAIATVERLRARYPDVNVALVVDARRHGTNAKISNVINMCGAADHEILIVSDSDIAVPSDYLRRLVAALEPKDVGAVTCLYTGWAVGGFASHLNAMGINYHFLPNAISGITLGLIQPCFGSTIALKRSVLDEIGGFEAVGGTLADDYEIGRAVRAKGHKVSVIPMMVQHACAEKGLSEWLSHELRWASTIRITAPIGHAGSIITHTFPVALVGVVLSGVTIPSLVVLTAALMVRAMVKWRIDRAFNPAGGPLWLLLIRDLMVFGIFLLSLRSGGSVVWRGECLDVARGGALSER